MNIHDIKLCDLYSPDYIIPIRDKEDSFPWYAWFKENDLQGIAYAFYFKNKLIKIGCSYANFHTRAKDNQSYGERLIRQIHNLPGRFKKNTTDYYLDGYGFIPKSDNGKDIVYTIKELENLYQTKIDKDQIYLHIWNITNKSSTIYHWFDDDFGNKERAKYFEGLLISQYKEDNNDSLPIGNQKQDPSTWNRSYSRPKISKEASVLFSIG